MSSLDTVRQQYQLSEDKFNQIQQLIIRLYTRGVTPSEKPKIVILGSQPGAGKTELEKIAILELKANAVICNADLFRDFHPEAEILKSRFAAYYPEITAEFSHRWNQGLRAFCEERELSYILETTFSSGERMNQTLADLNAKGYSVDIKLLAVHPRLSFLGTHLRYEWMMLNEKSGRMVSKAAHDERFLKIPETLALVSEKALYDRLEIYGRNIVLNKNSLTEGIFLVASNPAEPVKVFRTVVDHPWPDNLNVYFDERLKEVIQLKEQRGASKREINSFKNELKQEIVLKWPASPQAPQENKPEPLLRIEPRDPTKDSGIKFRR